jgi:two-component system, chemotaxis family, sensor kinase CheA
MSDSQVPEDLLSIYLEDARRHLETLDHCLLGLEREGIDQTLIQEVLGPLHTLKGNSGMMGFSGIKDYVHRLEDVFARIARGDLALDPAAFDRLFAGASALRDAVEQAGEARAEVRGLAPEKAELDEMLVGHGGGDTAPSWPASLPGHAARARPGAPAAKADAVAQYAAPRSSTVRVDFGKLDHLLNLVGELIVHRTKLDQVGHRMAHLLKDKETSQELLDTVQHVAGVSAQLQETVMDIRMLPIRHVFERFPRMVRDLARQQGKQIELLLQGDATRVDKAIIDEIGEPLVHLLRNSVDHGVETPQERVARGKSATGMILLSASQEASHVVITIVDDGAGIDQSRVRSKAVERGLLKGDETLSDREAIQLIFAQGFSTKEGVSDVSGRGVGLDVVLKSIERLSGLVEVESVPGVGTRFIIQIPLTLAIISALLVEVKDATYAVPLPAVLESLRFRPDEVHTINGREALRLRDRIIPLVRLSSRFGLPGQDRGDYAVILGRGEKRVGLVVERLKGQQEIVIKALDPSVLGAGSPVAGATVMGDGRVVLILDVAALFEGKQQAALSGRPETAARFAG